MKSGKQEPKNYSPVPMQIEDALRGLRADAERLKGELTDAKHGNFLCKRDEVRLQGELHKASVERLKMQAEVERLKTNNKKLVDALIYAYNLMGWDEEAKVLMAAAAESQTKGGEG